MGFRFYCIKLPVLVHEISGFPDKGGSWLPGLGTAKAEVQFRFIERKRKLASGFDAILMQI